MSNLHLSIGLCLLLGLVANAPSAWRLWLSQMEESYPAGIANLSFNELDGRFHEMVQCQKVDPERGDRYYNTASEITTEQEMRLEHFLRRHNLWDQFIAEDAQGKR